MLFYIWPIYGTWGGARVSLRYINRRAQCIDRGNVNCEYNHRKLLMTCATFCSYLLAYHERTTCILYVTPRNETFCNVTNLPGIILYKGIFWLLCSSKKKKLKKILINYCLSFFNLWIRIWAVKQVLRLRPITREAPSSGKCLQYKRLATPRYPKPYRASILQTNRVTWLSIRPGAARMRSVFLSWKYVLTLIFIIYYAFFMLTFYFIR